MASPAEVVRQYLINSGLVILPVVTGEVIPAQQLPGDGSTVCFTRSMPDDYDQAVCIFNTTGPIFGRRQRDGKQLMHPGVNVFVRTLDDTGYDLAVTLANALDASTRSTIMIDEMEYLVQSIYRTSPVISLGEEVGKQRQRWSINARVAFQDQQPIMG